MLRGIFGTKKSILPPPPKNQIEVVCPSCGAAQYEPRLVVSTFCKSCGVHLSVSKKKVTASAGSRSGAAGVDDLWNKDEPADTPAAGTSESIAAGEAPPAAAHLRDIIGAAPSPAKEPAEPAAVLPESVDLEPEPASADSDTETATVEDEPQAAAAPAPEPAAEISAPTTELSPSPAEPATEAPAPPPAPAPARAAAPKPEPAPASTLGMMKSQSVYRQQYFKEAECFECGHKLVVNRSCKATDCPQCSAVICLEDLDINQHHTEAIRTRGDVTIRRTGRVTAAAVECRDLRCLGIIEAEIRCAGDAVFRTEGAITRPVHCRKLTIEKGSDITFNHPVNATEIYINGRVSGQLTCTGKIIVGLYGSMNGDITARAVSMEPGGELNGAINIVSAPPAPPVELPAKA